MGLALLVVLAGCPVTKRPRPFTGKDAARVIQYTYAGMRVAQMQEARPYVHMELILVDAPGSRAEGLEPLLLETAIRGGCGNADAHAYAAALESAGAMLDVWAGEGFTAVRLRCLKEKVEPAFRLLCRGLMQPHFPEKEFEARKSKWLSALDMSAQDPGAAADALAWEAAFSKPDGVGANTQAALQGLHHADARALLLNEVLVRCRLNLVVVGPVDAEKVNDLLFDTLDQLPEGDCGNAPPTTPPQTEQVRARQDTRSLQAMTGILPAPAAASPDAFGVSTAADILSTRLRKRLVEDEGLALECEMRYVPLPPAHCRIHIRGPKVLRCAELVLSELRVARDQGFSPAALDSAKRWLEVERQLAHESAGALSAQMATALVTGGWQNFGTPEARLAALRPEHLQFVMERYFTGIAWGFVGDTIRMDRKTLLRF